MKTIEFRDTSIDLSQIDVDQFDMRYAPQFYLGNEDADFRVEIVWSILCNYTRHLYKNVLKEFIRNVRENNNALIVFHHLARIPKEVAYSEILLSLEPEYYGAACIASLDVFSKHDHDPSADDLRSLMRKLDCPIDPQFDRDIARYASAWLNAYFVGHLGVGKTPAMLSTTGRWFTGITPGKFQQMIIEEGYGG